MPERPAPSPAARRGAITAAALALVLVVAGCGTSSNVATTGGTGSNIGFVSGDGTVTVLSAARRKPAPVLTGTYLQGGRFDLASLRGHVVVLNVWASWCAPCRGEAAGLEATYQQFASRGVRFVGLDKETDLAAGEAFVRAFHVTYPSIRAGDGVALLALHASLPPMAVPTTLVLDTQGRVAARIVGPVTPGVLGPVITEILAEGSP
ncbi:MAG: TlpA family protein disulfide reductase [Actinomycetes bacterium]